MSRTIFASLALCGLFACIACSKSGGGQGEVITLPPMSETEEAEMKADLENQEVMADPRFIENQAP